MFSTSESIKWKKAMGPRETLLKELATNVIPRIKTTAEDSGGWRSDVLSPPNPLANEQ